MITENMTEEERKEWEEFQAHKAKKRAEEKAKEQREDYTLLVDEQIEKSIMELTTLSTQISDVKTRVLDNFKAVIDLKREVIKTKNVDDLKSHTFTSTDGTKRIEIGVYMLDGYADTVEEGIQMVRDYISGLATDDKSQRLVDAVLRLLSKDQKGNIKASRVIQLRKMAQDSGDEKFIEGVKIIEESYRPTPSKTFIRAARKNENNEWKKIPLGCTEG